MRYRFTALLLVMCLMLCGCEFSLPQMEYGFAREVSEEEQAKRLELVAAAQEWLGWKESDESFKPIIDLYNGHEPLAQGYVVKYTDQWCAAFVSAAAIKCGMTDIIPTECGCQRQIGLFDAISRWEEDDAYIPLPGDIIYFVLKGDLSEDCTAWSDHVGIVVGTNKDRIKVIEGNNGGAVRYRYIRVDDPTIRGFALPDYASII